MNIKLCGYMGVPDRLKKAVLLETERSYARILGKHVNEIKGIKLVFKKTEERWSDGFNRLIKGRYIVIVTPWRFRRPLKAQWLVAHELAHAVQILEGRLSQAPKMWHIYYARKKERKLTKYSYNKEKRRFTAAPWESEVRVVVNRVFGYERSDRAWGQEE